MAGPKGETYRESAKKQDVRTANIEAAKAVADAVRTSLGPRGMDKMVASANGEVLITNDGATILNRMTVTQPAAKMLVELSHSQDVVAGDGTTSVVVICGALLKKAQELLARGVHPTVISDAFTRAAAHACDVLERAAIPVDMTDREGLARAATTSLSSKVVSQHSSLLAPMAVDSVLRVLDPARPDLLDLRDIRIVCKVGGTVDDSQLLPDGTVFDQRAARAAGGPTRVEGAKIALVQFQLSPPKTDIENNVVVGDYAAMDRVYKEERNYILQLVKKIKATGCNVVLVQKSILRDAVTDLSLHYLAKAKIMVVRDIEREEIEFVSRTLGCLPVAHVDHLTPEKLGAAALVEEIDCGKGGRAVKVSGVAKPGRTATVLLRGSNKLVLAEADRSLHDALCVIRCLAHKGFMIAGGAAPEVEAMQRLHAWSKTLTGIEAHCVRAFAEALEVVPYTLAENAGLDPVAAVTELRNAHAQGRSNAGLNARRGGVGDMVEDRVVQPLLVTTSALSLATECVRMILKIDDIVPTRAYHPAGALRAPSTLRLVLGTVAGALAVLSASAAAAAGGEYDDLYAAAAARRRKAAMDAAWGALLRLPYTRKRVEELQQELDAAADEAARRHVERTFVREVDEDDDEGDEWVAALGDNNEDEDEDDAEVDL